jgi:hypothetical protein
MADLANDYNWPAAFEVANRDGINVVHGSKCDNSPFTPDDVAFTIAFCDGENDESSWLWVGVLTDGRYAFISAWCDYTGWG